MEGENLQGWNIPEELKRRLQREEEARKKGGLRKIYLEDFRKFRDDYSDELPDKEFIFALGSFFARAEKDEVITDKKVIEKIEYYRKHPFECSEGGVTTQEEIDLINETLNCVIKYLEELEEKEK